MESRKFADTRKFFSTDRRLRVAMGVVFEDTESPEITEGLSGVAEVRPSSSGHTQVYLDLNLGELTPSEGPVDRVEIPVPLELRGAPYGEVLLNNTKPGATVHFGRQGEDEPFGFNAMQRYISLRLYPQEKAPNPDWVFNPLFVRVSKIDDEGVEKTYFLRLDAKWQDDVITLEVTRDLKGTEVPGILIGI